MRKTQKRRYVPFLKISYKVRGGSFSRLYKLIKSERLHAENVCEQNSEITANIPFYSCKRFERICAECGCESERLEDGDIVKAVKWVLHRPALFIGLLMVLLLIMYLKNIVIRFDIKNENEKIRSDIMNVLKEKNITVGSYIPDIVLVDAERALKQRVEGISWAGITRKGNSLIIDVIENIPAKKGSYSRFPSHLIATENATVEKVMLLDGQLKTVIGSGVRKGDIIISGIVETNKSKWVNGKEEVESKVRYTRSMGTIEGTFERTVVFEQSFDDTVKKQTGNVYSQKYLRLFSADIPLFFKSKTGSFYTDEEVNNARVFGKDLPFGIRTLTLTEYDRKPIRYSKEQALDKCREKNSKYEKNFLSEYKIKNKTESIKYTDKCVRLEITYSLYGNICEEAAFFIKK